MITFSLVYNNTMIQKVVKAKEKKTIHSKHHKTFSYIDYYSTIIIIIIIIINDISINDYI